MKIKGFRVMKKLSGLLAVSLVAFMMAPAAFADIASTEYVDKNMEAQANKKKSGEELKSNDEVGYPSVAAAFSIANIALGDQAVIKEQGTDGASKALITNKNGSVETGLIDSVRLADGAVITTKIADANVTEGKLAKDSVTPLKVKNGLIKSGTNVTVSRDETTGVVTISSEDTKYTLPTATDKTLGGVKVDTAMSETSTNPVQNKVANAAIAVAQKTADKGVADAAAAQTTANKAVVANNAITAGTGTKITYDAKGLVTGSTSLAASDIPALTTGKITGLDDALAAKFVAPGTSVTSTDGTYTLTMKVADGKPTYAWESIGR